MSEAKTVTFDELKVNSKKDKIWILLHGKGMFSSNPPMRERALLTLTTSVYDVTKFLDEVC